MRTRVSPHLTLSRWSALLLIAACARAPEPAPGPAPASAPPAAQPPAQAAAPSGPPGTDIWIAPLQRAEGPGVGTPRNVTSRAGYDNQPSFTPDSRFLLFTSIRSGGQADIWRYDPADRLARVVALTAIESEYSPTPTPDGGISVVRVERDSTQRLWRMSTGGDDFRVILERVKPVGYHAWADDTTLALFVLGEPATLQRAAPGSPLTETIASGIGRSLVAIPGTRAVSFTTRDENGIWWIKRYDADTGEVRALVHAVEGAGEPHTAWARDGRLFMAAGTRVFTWKEGAADWTPLGDLAAAPVTAISRLAVSPDGRWLAFVAENR